MIPRRPEGRSLMSAPSWYKRQPFSPHQVYSTETIRDIQRTLSCPESGEMDERTVNHIKAYSMRWACRGPEE